MKGVPTCGADLPLKKRDADRPGQNELCSGQMKDAYALKLDLYLISLYQGYGISNYSTNLTPT